MKTWDSVRTFRRNFGRLIGNYEMSLTQIIPDGDLQIHMIIHGGSRRKASTMPKGRNDVGVGRVVVVVGALSERLSV